MAKLPRRPAASSSTTVVGIAARDWPRFRSRLLSWFRRNQRDLPWRRARTPYRVWLSEVMLQQTRVAAVIPYYRRFLKEFPTLRQLARARTSSVLRAWAGLGYYSRARHLHRSAQEMVAKHGGKFPRDHQTALRLPGIGRYTAAAILSIAYQEPLAALDGNVARVLARLGAMRGDLRRPQAWRKLEQAADALLASEAPGDWNEAMMELGATVCTPLAPRCEACPVARWCQARKLGIAAELPAVRRKAAPRRITVAAAVLLDPSGRTLLVREPNGNGAVFARLWQFPAVEAADEAHPSLGDHLQSIAGPALGNARALDAAMQRLTPARHTVTVRDIRLLPFLLRVPRLPAVRGARTPLLAALDRLPVSSATRKIAAAALREV